MPRKPTPVRYCKSCGALLTRKRYPAGSEESLPRFLERQFCDQTCMGKADKKLPDFIFCPTCKKKFPPIRIGQVYCGVECFQKVGETAKELAAERSITAHTSRGRAKRVKKRVACERCGGTRRLSVHHKDENPFNNAPSNLEVLCSPCHAKHHNPKGTCKVCGKAQKGRGYCEKHLERSKKYGDPLLTRTSRWYGPQRVAT